MIFVNFCENNNYLKTSTDLGISRQTVSKYFRYLNKIIDKFAKKERMNNRIEEIIINKHKEIIYEIDESLLSHLTDKELTRYQSQI